MITFGKESASTQVPALSAGDQLHNQPVGDTEEAHLNGSPVFYLLDIPAFPLLPESIQLPGFDAPLVPMITVYKEVQPPKRYKDTGKVAAFQLNQHRDLLDPEADRLESHAQLCGEIDNAIGDRGGDSGDIFLSPYRNLGASRANPFEEDKNHHHTQPFRDDGLSSSAE